MHGTGRLQLLKMLHDILLGGQVVVCFGPSTSSGQTLLVRKSDPGSQPGQPVVLWLIQLLSERKSGQPIALSQVETLPKDHVMTWRVGRRCS